MAQEFVLEVIQDVSFFQRVRTKKGIRNKFRYRTERDFHKLRSKTIKGIQKEIDLIIGKYGGSVVDWKIYISFPFE